MDFHPSRRQLLAALAATPFAAVAPLARAQAAWKPAAPVKIVVPFPPGGSSDILARFISAGVGEKLGQPVLIENKPGATGSIGSTFVYGAPADGTTLLLGITDANSIYPHLTQTRYDATKFVPVAPLASTGFVLLGRPDLPANNLQELLALLHKEKLSYASAGAGSGPHMMAVAFARAAKADNLLHVPYTGMAPALTALMAKQVDIMLVAVGGAAQYRSKLKFYGVSSAQRVAAIPDVPTLKEQGLDIVGEAWMGVLAPPNTPAATTAAIARAVNEVTATPEYKAKVQELGMSTLTGSPADFSKLYMDEYRKWGELVRAANIKLE
ncbi:MAG TPA: tripartite tricarboxylate transporter substrate binding protein [Ramlibacter sp.]|nr:tripartite tricarboxylate transporter substrate binding protein [Ramlibacter sp.]